MDDASKTIRCPNCSATLRFHPEKIGQSVKCPGCKHSFPHPPQATQDAPPAKTDDAALAESADLVACPSCNAKLRFHPEKIGTKVRCPGCKNVFDHPAEPWKPGKESSDSHISDLMDVIDPNALAPAPEARPEVPDANAAGAAAAGDAAADEAAAAPVPDLRSRGVVALILYLLCYAGLAVGKALGKPDMFLAVAAPVLLVATLLTIVWLIRAHEAAVSQKRTAPGAPMLTFCLWMFTILPVIAFLSYLLVVFFKSIFSNM
jgi:predicted Zn finger-like uncharacterized protein